MSVGHVGFFKSLMKEAGFSEEDEAKIRSLITMKNFFGVEEFLESFSLNEKLKKALITLPEMFGSSEVLDRAESLTDNEEALAAVKRLKEIYELLKIYGVEKYISFDFGMLNKYQILHRRDFPGLHLRHRRRRGKGRPLRPSSGPFRKAFSLHRFCRGGGSASVRPWKTENRRSCGADVRLC